MSGCRTARKAGVGGTDLADAHDVGIVCSHQVHDLPEVRMKVSQHEVCRVGCLCGAEHVGSLPAEVPSAPSSYGPNLKTLAVYLLVYQHVPVAHCVQLIADCAAGRGPGRGSCTACWPGARGRWPRSPR
jgi:hypothetical protein